MSVEEWRALVGTFLYQRALSAFGKEVIKRAGSAGNIDDMNRWLGFASAIWNATPQRDRGGRTAYDLSTSGRGRPS
jgi:hypothetical protein